MPQPRIREALPADALAIEALYRQLVSNSAVCVTAERVGQVGQDPNTMLLVGDIEGSVVGTALVSLCADVMFREQPFAVIENIVIDASLRHTGVGRSLMQAVEDVCHRAQCSKIMLLSSSDRHETHAFFEQLGYLGSAKRGFVKYRRQFRALEPHRHGRRRAPP